MGWSERRGVTLIEVLIAIGIVSILAGLLAPAIGKARAAAHSAACKSMQKQIYAQTMSWSFARKDVLPAVSTTGRQFYGSGDAHRRAMALHGNTSSTTPVSTFDWISPVMGHVAQLSPNRARRTKQIFEDLGCAGAQAMNDALFDRAPDDEQFEALLETEGIGQISYLAPGPFHLLGAPNRAYGNPEAPFFRWRGPAMTPSDYFPRMDRIGTQPAAKIFLADGTRYLASNGTLDFDLNVKPDFYGSFTSSTPIYRGSTAYGRHPHRAEFAAERRPSKSTYPRNRDLSYRHGRRINVIHFDGSMDSMTEFESKRDASPWYPSGSVFTGYNATEESRAFHNVDDVLH